MLKTDFLPDRLCFNHVNILRHLELLLFTRSNNDNVIDILSIGTGFCNWYIELFFFI